MAKQEYLMYPKDSCWDAPYIVTATSRLEAAKVLASERRMDVDQIKERYMPEELNLVKRIGGEVYEN